MEARSFGPVRFIPGTNRGKYPQCHSIFEELMTESRVVFEEGRYRRV